MKVTDPVADLLTRIRNAQSARKDVISVPASRLKISVTHLLKQEGFIKAYKCIKDERQGVIKIALKYRDERAEQGVIRFLDRKSKPGRRVYVRSEKIPYIKSGFGIAILSTSEGVMTCREARKRNVGGEWLCSVY
ncbi:MAG: 30S ribosomal protein S8 [Deltaproteobacteria bacterium]|nr:30S ribosomal protein S8 [Deltaproteobacteria bacterium]